VAAHREGDGRPERWISWASWTPVADAPTTRTPPPSSWSGLRYSVAGSDVTAAGTASAKAGMFARLQAPLATTAVRARERPLVVVIM